MGNDCFLLLLLLFALASTFVAPSPTRSALPPHTPSFMMNLYKCVNQSSPLNCYGVDAKSVSSLLGSYQKNDSAITSFTNAMEFNMSRLVNLMSQNNGKPLWVEVRVYRRSLSQSERDYLDAMGCSSTTVQLYATIGKENAKSTAVLISSASLRSCEMGSEQWVGFGNLTSMYTAWARDDQSQFQTLTLGTKGQCGLQLLGFADSEEKEYEPLMVAYFAGSSGRLDVINGAISSSVASSLPVAQVPSGLGKRDVTRCALQQYEIDLNALGLTNYFPSTYPANLCRGQCTVPIGASDPLYPTEHAVFQYFLSTRNTAIAPPCCVPLNYALHSFLIFETSTVTLTSLPRAIATSCQCA